MSHYKVLITDGLAKEGLDLFQAHPEFKVDVRKATSANELAEIIGNYDSIVIRSATTLTKDLIERATSMKLIVRAGAGVDNIDVPVATARKLPVMNTASANSLAAAEQTIALMFATFRCIPQAAQSLREGRWDRTTFKGFEVTGKTMGVVGLGNIGRIVAEKALGLGMKVVGFDPMLKTSAHLPAGVHIKATLDEILPLADVLTLHIPKSPQTTNLINASKISQMKKGSFLLNCARGGLVDEKAVIAALDSGQLNGAAFDVFEKEPPEFPNPLFTHPKIVCAPHLGASTVEAQDRVATTAVQQIIGFFKRAERTGVINL